MTIVHDRRVPSSPVVDTCDGKHEFKRHSFRQRGLFPLRCVGSTLRARSGLSRRCQQRAGRRHQLHQRVSEMTCALNSLYGVEGYPPTQRVSPAQSEAQ